jgi:hypothetical protein
MNKGWPGEAVLRGGLAGEEAAARAINAEPWDPLPGMTKALCPQLPLFLRGPNRRCDAALPGLCDGGDEDSGVTITPVNQPLSERAHTFPPPARSSAIRARAPRLSASPRGARVIAPYSRTMAAAQHAAGPLRPCARVVQGVPPSGRCGSASP